MNNTHIKTILILAANPTSTKRLRLDEEVRSIEEGLRRANKREQFKLVQKWAVRPRDFYRAILDYQPQIVHFCGHGAGVDGIVLEDETGQAALVSADALAGMFEVFGQNGVECAMLNACFSKVQAEAISQHVNYVIGMNQALGDRAAIDFAVAFYDAVAAGQDVELAFKLGCSQLIGLGEHLTPELKKRAVIVPSKSNFIPPNPYQGLFAFGEGIKPPREVIDKVEQIVNEYTRLFVGREEEIQEIDKFFTKNSRGVVLVTSSAGFGKTALLAHLVNRWQDKDYFIAYHFFSQHGDNITRSIVNAYRNLLRQLLIHYELESKPLANDENQLRDMLYSLIKDWKAKDGKPLVIVLDALDEAECPFSPPFPNQLPENVYVVASARAEEGEEPRYLESWTDNSQQLHLERLSKGAIADWLRRTGEGELVKLANNTYFVTQLDEITQGFPLYLNYLTDELSHVAKQGQDVWKILTQTPSEFKRYVNQQLKRLDELDLPDERWQFFALLAVAKGVLEKEDIKVLTGMRDRQLRQLHQCWQVTRWMRITEDKFFAFAHPLLSTTFTAELGDDALDALEKLIDYCANWQEHQSCYALRHYTEHLLQAKQWNKLYAIARNQDFAATQRKYLPDEPDLPLQTVRTALQGAAEEDQPREMAEFLLVHAQRLLQSTAHDTPLDALRKGNLNQAFAVADLYEIERCALWYLLLAWELKDTGRLDEAQTALEKLRQKELVCGFGLRVGTDSRRASYPDYAAYILAYIYDINKDAFTDLTKRLLYDDQQLILYKTLAERSCTYLTIALETALSLDDNWSKIQALADIGAAQAKAGDRMTAEKTFNFILDTAQPIDDKYKLIAAAQAQAGDINAAIKAVHKIENKENQVWALGQIAIAQAKVKYVEEAKANLATALEIAQKIDNIWKKSQALQEVAIAQAEAGFVDNALETAKETGWGCTRENVLISVVKMYAQSRNIEAAWNIVEQIMQEKPKDLFVRSRVLEPIAIAFAEYGSLDAAFSVVLKMVYDKERVVGLIAAKMAIIGATGIARDLFTLVLKTTTWFKEPQQKQSEALSMVAQVQAEVGYTNKARDTFTAAISIAQKIQDEGSKDWALQTITEIQVRNKQLTAALNTVNLMVNKQGRLLDVLPSIAIAYGQLGDKRTAKSIFTRVLETARKLDNEPGKEAILREIAKGQAQIGDFNTALEIAQENGRDFTIPQVLGVIALVQVQDGKKELARATFATAVEEAQKIETSWERSWALQIIVESQAQTYLEEFLIAALQTSSKIDTQMHKVKALQEITKVRMQLGQFAAALEIAQQMQAEGEQAVEAMTMVAEAQAKLGTLEAAQNTYNKALKLIQSIIDDGIKARVLEIVAKSQVKSSFGFQAIKTSDKILINRNQHLSNIAKVLAETGDKENFKHLLIKSAYYLDAAYEMCGCLARLYPHIEQTTAVAKVVSEVHG